MEAAATGVEVNLSGEAARAPRGDKARELPTCDLVMKGGITSGVVYPGAVIALAHSFRFAALGGTSAGAIAAGVCAAAEYGRLRDEEGGLVELGAVSDDLAKEDFLAGLFQATPSGRSLMDLALVPMSHPNDSAPRRAVRIAIAACRAVPAIALPALTVALGLGLLTWGAFRGFPAPLAGALTVVVALPLLALVLALLVLGAVGWLVARAARSLPDSNYGLCPGTHQPGYPSAQPALTDWLDERVQAAAGRPIGEWNEVLTVDDLRDCEITLETMTTDLSRARPLRCPADLADYSFKPSEMRDVFPPHVVARMVQPDPRAAAPTADELQSGELHPLDPERLPVLVAIRLSLSFPVLLSAVPVYLRDKNGGDARRSLLSDGGIVSNFPVHFFDAWFPRWPTFGINLESHPGETAKYVLMHGEDGASAHREIDGLGAFGGQIKDTMQNWRDNLQAEMAGYKGRICDVRFAEGEGGLSLKMQLPAIKTLMQRGYEAGRTLAAALPMTPPGSPPTAEWTHHCLTRFEILMWLEQQGLQTVAERSGDFLSELAGGKITPGRGPWAGAASEQTLALLACVKHWGPDGLVEFEHPDPPEPVMRVVPKA
jgi:predicted acylesterase/phospholipase RssA